MCVPTYVNDLLIHFREQLLWAATIYSISTACRLFGLTPKTFFKCKRLMALWEQSGCSGPNPLGYRPPRPQRSNAKPAQVRERVLQLKREYPTYGKRRLAAEYIERYQGQIAPNTVQKFLKAERQNLPAPQRRIQYWSFFFIALLDDHSRAPVAAD